MENNTYIYQYSAQKNKEIENIRKKYLPQEISKIERLKKLDSKVQSAGQIPALSIGIIGCLIFGAGMCFGLDVLSGADWISILLCAVGTAVMIPAYSIYKRISSKVKAELAPEILKLSDEIINESAQD
ncbi:MAG: hypothetical protein IKL59_03980 [Clostridia bacterium]|nr:hypothetical protein [Clostridia bacterium]